MHDPFFNAAARSAPRLLQKNLPQGFELEDTLNYDLIVDIFKEEASGPHIALQETLIDRIAKRITALPGVALVRAEVSKPDAYSNAGAVGIEVWRAPASPSERTIQ